MINLIFAAILVPTALSFSATKITTTASVASLSTQSSGAFHSSYRFASCPCYEPLRVVQVNRIRRTLPKWLFNRPQSHQGVTRTAIFQEQSSSSSSSLSNYDGAASADSAAAAGRFCRARDLMQSLIEDEQCFTTVKGAQAFGNVCDLNVIYEDRFESQPQVGRMAVTQHMLNKVAQRQSRPDVRVRIDRISDGDRACGFAWTWTCGDQEGLRGTTYVELNDRGLIQYVQEIPEPIFKPGDLTRQLLAAITDGAQPKPARPFESKTPTVAHELVKYLFLELQQADPQEGTEELMRFFDDNVIYRDFNFEEPFRGPAQVRKFVEDFRFPGIEFRPLRYDDGVDCCALTWEVVLEGADDTIKGLSLYELDPVSRKIVYVRDVPESAIKPPILGSLARKLRPGLGVFQGVPLGSRPGGK